jgi:hypothetical protein
MHRDLEAATARREINRAKLCKLQRAGNARTHVNHQNQRRTPLGTMSAGAVFELSSGSLDLNGTLAVTAPVSRTGRDSPPLNPLRFIMIC